MVWIATVFVALGAITAWLLIEPGILSSEERVLLAINSVVVTDRQLKSEASGGLTSAKLLKPTPTRRNRCDSSDPNRSRNKSAMLVSYSQVSGGFAGVKLRVRMVKSLVLSLSTTVRATLFSFRETFHTFSAKCRINPSVSDKDASRSSVSSAEIDFVGRLATTGLWSMPRASS